MEKDFSYPGKELELFSKANNWRKYMTGFIIPHITGRVLEAGAGLGIMTSCMNNSMVQEWILLEPDKKMSIVLNDKITTGVLNKNCSVINGTIENAGTILFDAIVYIDVLEHIADDKAEINKAAALLKPGGNLIILSPAFQFLFSPFDKAIGHFRRYSKTSLQKAISPNLIKESVRYLDTAGFLSSLANKLLLKQKYPTEKQLAFWDKFLIPVSFFLDKLFFFSFGKSVLGIWKKELTDGATAVPYLTSQS